MEERDPWLAVDKFEHVFACFFISVLVAALASRSHRPFIRRRSVALGSITALAAGAAKEACDEIGLWKSAGGSVRDAAADALGVALAVAVLAAAKCIKKSGQRRRGLERDQEELSMV
ncbi:uncharacterized protein LOC110029847 [Phalaenopsis equestris]|uniref:uncharacterized protein LOC110029847 n=1 Tax=Phalaenopsis equestris TaxID=78828 RepID=UPI0009E40715|nr:uncharacterized protein LOC110029847 [Phalaenopsis equestris]